MLKVRIKKTGEIKTVTNNVAHGLIERGEAVIYKQRMMSPGDTRSKSKRREVYKTK